jgi:hypothetical protein
MNRTPVTSIVVSIAIGVMAVLVSTVPVFAVPVPGIDSAAITNSTGAAQTTFTWTQTPYINSVVDQGSVSLLQVWQFGAASWNFNVSDDETGDLNNATKTIFNTFPTWTSIRQAGNWTISETPYKNGGTGTPQSRTFTVNAVPEPVSATLFLLGGVALVGRAIRKNKKQS